MLTSQDNELLCRIGPGTPMGNLMRRYWIPAVLPIDIPEPDCAPVRVRLLGEDLVAFRDSNGRPGLIGANCPHRGASLYFGRNEEAGLRCVYHGWKFDTEGNCVDMPNEPAESNFKHKIRATAYPCVERGGIIWAYLGPPEQRPAMLSELMSNVLPDSHTNVTCRALECNYTQLLEGGLDSSHAGFLHSRLQKARPEQDTTPPLDTNSLLQRDRHPHIETVDTTWGVMVGARRQLGADQDYWRASQFFMPFYHMSPRASDDPMYRFSAWVPIDDVNTMRWEVSWNPVAPIRQDDIADWRVADHGRYVLGSDEYEPSTFLPGGRWRTKASKRNDYLIDREVQRTVNYTGIMGPGTQDQAVQESMGKIMDRTKEHLGGADAGVIAIRRRLLRAAKILHDRDVAPPGVLEPAAYRVISASALLPRGSDWVGGMAERIVAREGSFSEIM